ncbi:MAG: helix-turn-helix domain-containing protein [Eubacteriales bacterium]|nr:helix-turn-helix domain-containing protein [Eubacteriales bacterium]
MTFAIKLKELRTLAGISQEKLAEKIGVSGVMISQYENGKKMPSRETIKKIAAFFGVSSSDMIGDSSGEKLSDEIIILNRGAKKMSPEKQKQLLDIAKVMFKEEFTEDDD